MEMLNRLHQGDCLDVLQQLPDRSIDLVLCDLPYNMTRNRWDEEIPLDTLWPQYKRVLKPTGCVVLTSCQPFTSLLVMSNPQWFRREIIWKKNKSSDFMNAKRQPMRIHENILVFAPKQPAYYPQFTEGTPYVRWNTQAAVDRQTNFGAHKANVARSDGERYPTTVLEFDRVPRPLHPTQKPIDLGLWCVRSYSNPGDVVLDNAFGSGAFLEAAVRCGRNFVGIDKYRVIDGKYGPFDQFAYAEQQIRAALADVRDGQEAETLQWCGILAEDDADA